jgi:hypothetical protein
VSKAALIILTTSLILATTAQAADLDPAKLDQARSLIAEAVLLEHAAAAGQVTGPAAEALRGELKDDLQKLTKEPAFAAVVRQALAALARRDAATLAALRDHLVQLERSHGRVG